MWGEFACDLRIAAIRFCRSLYRSLPMFVNSRNFCNCTSQFSLYYSNVCMIEQENHRLPDHWLKLFYIIKLFIKFIFKKLNRCQEHAFVSMNYFFDDFIFSCIFTWCGGYRWHVNWQSSGSPVSTGSLGYRWVSVRLVRTFGRLNFGKRFNFVLVTIFGVDLLDGLLKAFQHLHQYAACGAFGRTETRPKTTKSSTRFRSLYFQWQILHDPVGLSTQNQPDAEQTDQRTGYACHHDHDVEHIVLAWIT